MSLCVLLCLLTLAEPAFAGPDAAVGFSRLSYTCPSATEIDFTWSPAVNATFYSLQLVEPLDAGQNGGVAGTFLRQYGSVEVAKGGSGAANVTLAAGSLPNETTLYWQLMIGGPHGYTGMVPREQVALIPAPCTPTSSPVQSPYY